MFYKLTLYTSTVILNVQKNSKSLENLYNCKLIFQLSRSSKPIMFKYSCVTDLSRFWKNWWDPSQEVVKWKLNAFESSLEKTVTIQAWQYGKDFILDFSFRNWNSCCKWMRSFVKTM